MGYLSPKVACLLGLVYLAASVGGSVWFVVLIAPYMSNDLYWPDFALTGAHSYLLDVYRLHLLTAETGSFDLFAESEAIAKDYNTPTTTREMQAAYARSVLYQQTSMRESIITLRNTPSSLAAQLYTQYCWVDLDKRWELAHTALRQKRCQTNHTTNAAVYIEPVLRNIDWDDFVDAYGSPFALYISDAVVATPGGDVWLASVQGAMLSVDAEVAYWTTKGAASFTLQWSNMFQVGAFETISIQNALGQQQQLTTSSIAFVNKGTSWTTMVANCGLFNDLYAAAILNASLVRAAPNFMGDNTIEPLANAYPYTPCSYIVHNLLGPFISIDVWYIMPPASVIALVTAMQKILVSALQDDPQVRDLYRQLSAITLDPVPTTWHGAELTYFGGSPMCVFGAGATFVQRQISFDDSCSTQVPSSVLLTVSAQVFASSASALIDAAAGSIPIVCGHCSTSLAPLCTTVLAATDRFAAALAPKTAALLPLATRAHDSVKALGVEMIQFVLSNGSTELVLHQPLLGGNWTYFGSAMLFEWVYAYREVVAFEGDAASFVLMSERLESMPAVPSASETPASTCRYLWYVAVATSGVIACVAAITAAFVIAGGCTVDGAKLLWFPRVAGPVWVGRPLLLVRAATALIVLSSPPIEFRSDGGIGRFVFAPRSVVTTVILTGEAAWLTYVISDLLLVLTPSVAPVAAPMSSGVVWLVSFLLELVAPVQPSV
ncbi:hypothetical protein ACHHYP_03667, partial [Achlya hypogyna]